MNFIEIDYLKFGNARQKRAHAVLTQHAILSNLKKYDPIMVGTIPLTIDINTSDIDIICYWTDKDEFVTCVKKNFNTHKNFRIKDAANARDSVLATFTLEDFEFEIFGQNTPTQQQLAYRHMIVEYHLLEEHGEEFRLKIIDLKLQGYKTEHAFAHLLKLDGNPYEELLKVKINTFL